MTAMKRILPTAAALVAVAALMALFRTVQRWDPAAISAAESPDQLALEARDAVMMARERGVPLWRMRVDRIIVRRAQGSDLMDFHAVDFGGVRQGVVYDGERQAATFRAESATYERPTKRLNVERGIRLRYDDGTMFSTERCVWTERDEFARFPAGAQVDVKGDRVTAPVMVYSTRTRLVQCPNGADGVFRGQPIAAGGLEWDTGEGTVRCSGPVTGKRGDASFVAQYAELNLKERTLRVNKGMLDLRIDSGTEGAQR
jgi:hypothetical protein